MAQKKPITTKRERKYPVVTSKNEDRFLCVKCDNLSENEDLMHCFDCRLAWEQSRKAF